MEKQDDNIEQDAEIKAILKALTQTLLLMWKSVLTNCIITIFSGLLNLLLPIPLLLHFQETEEFAQSQPMPLRWKFTGKLEIIWICATPGLQIVASGKHRAGLNISTKCELRPYVWHPKILIKLNFIFCWQFIIV